VNDILAVAISDDDKFLVTGGKDRFIKLWNFSDLTLIKSFKGHRDRVNCIKFGRNSHTLFTASSDRSIKIWNLDDMIFIDTLFGHKSIILDMDTYINERLVSCGFDKTARIWKTAEES